MSVQFNKNASEDAWYSLMYQSNKQLNDESHHQIKVMIARILVEQVKIKEIYTHIHGTLIFSILAKNPLTKFDEIVNKLRIPITTHEKQLLFSVTMVGRDGSAPPKRYMYVDGSDDMDAHFKNLIKAFYPPKAPQKHFFSIKK